MKNTIFIISAILLVSCSRKQVPQVTIPTKVDKCDSTIQALIDSIQEVEPIVISEIIYKDGVADTVRIIDSSNCNYYKSQALQLASKLHTSNKEVEYFKALAQSRAKKIINNINSGNKNTQIGDANVQQKSKSAPNQNGEANIAQQTDKGVSQNGDDNNGGYKPKQSAVGNGNDLDNSKKGSSWFWIFIAGNLCWLIMQNLLYPILMRFIPFANLTSNIGKALLKLKFW